MRSVLWHIAISHYSEKARWALDFKGMEAELRAPPPGPHMAVAAWLTRGRSITFPILQLDGDAIADSSAIIAALEQRVPEPPLYPREPELRRRALALEDWFDEQVGPYVRRFAFHELRRETDRFDRLAAQATPALSSRLGAARVGTFARAFTGARYQARSDERAAVARQRVLAGFDRLEAELGADRYLVGGRFTVADLTAAAILYPIVLPPEGPVALDDMPEAYRRWRTTLEGRRGWAWVQQIYARHRHAAAETPTAAR